MSIHEARKALEAKIAEAAIEFQTNTGVVIKKIVYEPIMIEI